MNEFSFSKGAVSVCNARLTWCGGDKGGDSVLRQLQPCAHVPAGAYGGSSLEGQPISLPEITSAQVLCGIQVGAGLSPLHAAHSPKSSSTMLRIFYDEKQHSTVLNFKYLMLAKLRFFFVPF